jgi:hypothetical protein
MGSGWCSMMVARLLLLRIGTFFYAEISVVVLTNFLL